MALSAFEMFSIGIGPSSSHTVGPMRASKRFAVELLDSGLLGSTARVRVELFGSLGATGLGHSSDKAILLGLQGEDPETVSTGAVDAQVAAIVDGRILNLAGRHPIAFDRELDLLLNRRVALSGHPNGMTFTAFDSDGSALLEKNLYSIGGGFVVDDAGLKADGPIRDAKGVPFPFASSEELLQHCKREKLRISDIVLANELTWRSEEEIRAGLLHIWSVMRECVRNGYSSQEPLLPGKLKVRRRAPSLYRELMDAGVVEHYHAMEWVNLFALAVNEENAAGGRVVTAPTNGAAGIIPAVMHYYEKFVPDADDDGIVRFLLTATAIGILFKTNASISGAEVGCQGEVGSACSMAAAGLCEVLGGTPEQIENAAEIGIEHNLGLTCDPVGGLVQIPCIERNAIAANKAINAARMAIRGDGVHLVSLDQAIKTMRDTGADMKTKYKETSRGGLAVNVVEC